MPRTLNCNLEWKLWRAVQRPLTDAADRRDPLLSMAVDWPETEEWPATAPVVWE